MNSMEEQYDKLHKLQNYCSLIATALNIHDIVDKRINNDMIRIVELYHPYTEVHIRNTLDDMMNAADELVNTIINLVQVELSESI